MLHVWHDRGCLREQQSSCLLTRYSSLQCHARKLHYKFLLIVPLLPDIPVAFTASTKGEKTRPQEASLAKQQSSKIAESKAGGDGGQEESLREDEDSHKSYLYGQSKARSAAVLVSVGTTKVLTAVAMTLMVPFFLSEAKKKTEDGASIGFHAEAGLVFTVGKFVEVLLVPFVSKDLPNIGSKNLLILSVFTIGCTVVLFSFLEDVEGLSWFFGLGYGSRIIQDVATMAFNMSALTLLMGLFPESVGGMSALIEAGAVLGWAVGPLLSGILYEVGGFKLPFMVGGGSLLFAAIVLLVVLPAEKPTKCDDTKLRVSWWKVLSTVWVWIICFNMFLANFIQAMADVTLPEYFSSKFHTAIHVSGYALFLLGITGFLASPCVGYLVDRTRSFAGLEILACFLCLLGCLVVGPARFLHLSPALPYSFCAMIFLASGCMMLIVSGVAHLTIVLTSLGLGDARDVRYVVAGVTRIALSLGYGTGGVASGTLKAAIGFSNAYSVVGFILLSQAILIAMALTLPGITERVSTVNQHTTILEENLYSLVFG